MGKENGWICRVKQKKFLRIIEIVNIQKSHNYCFVWGKFIKKKQIKQLKYFNKHF